MEEIRPVNVWVFIIMNLANGDRTEGPLKSIRKSSLRVLGAALAFPLVLATGLSSGNSLAAASSADSPRVTQCFDSGWAFFKGDPKGADQRSFDDSSWRSLDLPHDWSIEGPFDERNPFAAPGGYLPCGTGWYRKAFRLPADTGGKMVFIEFDGIYMNGEVWINGHLLGKRPYGFIGCEYDLTPHLEPEGENVLSVRVDHSLQPSARWYTGSGIYRHVWLKFTDPLRIARWGTRVTTPSISPDMAEVMVESTVRNDNSAGKSVAVRQSVIDAEGSVIATTEGSLEVAAGSEQTFSQKLGITRPALWSPDSPNLYTLRTVLADGGRVVDCYDTSFGVRDVRFDVKTGLSINGQNLKMKGVCNHQDLGPLGTALWDQALERRMRMLKDMGCNAIRTAHYPHSPELLALCDRLGFLVINETFDEWRRGWDFEGKLLVASKTNTGKARFGYNRYFDNWHARDLSDHLKRDRNHPCVIMWSVGNEVPESVKNGETETVGILRDLCHKIDPTRPVTVGCNHIKSANASGFTEQLDIVGYNEGVDSVFEIEGDLVRYPQRLMYLSELPHSLQTRGEYRSHPRYYRPGFDHPKLTDNEVFPETDAYYESSYDNSGVQTDARRSWRMTSSMPRIMGEFRWTGFDYIGESGGWPRVLGNYGIIDICNFPKDHYYFYQSRWTDKPMVHILPHWTWPGKEGAAIPVWCYTNCEEAELFLNGSSLGVRKFEGKNDMHLEWLVPYQPGELKVVARKNGKVAATTSHRTAGVPARIAISADQSTLDPAKRDLSYITVRVEDENGNFAPKAAKWVGIRIEGPGRLIGSGSGDPLSHTPFQDSTFRTFNGLGLAIITASSGPEPAIDMGSTRKPNEIIVRATCKGMEPVELRLIRTADGPLQTPVDGTALPKNPAIEGVDGLPSAK
jgi:beta-galactosidase